MYIDSNSGSGISIALSARDIGLLVTVLLLLGLLHSLRHTWSKHAACQPCTYITQVAREV